jgi:hypothetical protein
MNRVDRTFSTRTFGTTAKVKSKSPEAYVREVRKFVARERRDLKPARRAIAKARKVLKDVDEGALLDVPSWPAIGGAGDLSKAEDVSHDERAYLETSRRFVPRYSRLVEYASKEIDFADQIGLAMGNGLAALPEHPTSPEQVARPIDSVAAKIEKITRDYRRTKPPRDVKRTVDETVGVSRFISRTFRGFADAVRARDLAKINQFDETLSKGVDRYKLGSKSLRALLTKSSYSRQLHRLRILEQRADAGYERF